MKMQPIPDTKETTINHKEASMKNNIITAIAAAVLTAFQSPAFAHDGGKHVRLHINPRWSECSFQLDPALTQDA